MPERNLKIRLNQRIQDYHIFYIHLAENHSKEDITRNSNTNNYSSLRERILSKGMEPEIELTRIGNQQEYIKIDQK